MFPLGSAVRCPGRCPPLRFPEPAARWRRCAWEDAAGPDGAAGPGRGWEKNEAGAELEPSRAREKPGSGEARGWAAAARAARAVPAGRLYRREASPLLTTPDGGYAAAALIRHPSPTAFPRRGAVSLSIGGHQGAICRRDAPDLGINLNLGAGPEEVGAERRYL